VDSNQRLPETLTDLFRYLDEQTFRFNTRKVKDGARFLHTAAGIICKRLTYKTLTGSEVPAT